MVPHGPREAAASEKSEALSSPQFDVEYRIGHLIEQTEAGPGGIERVSVGIVIPDPSTQSLTIDAVKDLVAAGIGLDPLRGDRIAVYPVASLSKASGQGVLPGAASPLSESGHAALGGHPKPIWALLLGVALLFGAIAIWLGRPRRAVQMSESERQELLNQVKVWLQQ